MKIKVLFFVYLFIECCLICTVGCTNLSGQLNETETLSSNENEINKEDSIIVDAVSTLENDSMSQNESNSPPGGASQDNPDTLANSNDGAESTLTDIYENDIYKFEIEYPANFIYRIQDGEQFELLNPRPTVSINFLSPTKASSELGDLELADLEIRAFPIEQSMSLDNWLASNVQSQGNTLKPFQTANIIGRELCSSTMAFPRCSYFVFGESGWVFQLIPTSVEGEIMINSFRFSE
ncbi:hypothetical protein [Candidatus Leptofilum sp.]|uniref:hypothetical protein n=1 Tax=Candidatus Leptofilum sp. TaxID=3241576 RepID=UPI003B5B2A40